VNISFFLGITVGPMLITLLELLNAGRRAALPGAAPKPQPCNIFHRLQKHRRTKNLFII